MFKNEYKQQVGSKVLYSTSRLILVVSETEQKESFQQRNLFMCTVPLYVQYKGAKRIVSVYFE